MHKTCPQNKDTQKVDSEKRNRFHAMIRHQNADATVLASALIRSIPPPWTSVILNIGGGGGGGAMPLISTLARTMASSF